MLSFHVKFVQTDRRTDLSMRGHKNSFIHFVSKVFARLRPMIDFQCYKVVSVAGYKIMDSYSSNFLSETSR